MKSFPTAMVFDWDNTLVDSWPSIMSAINATRKNFGLSEWGMDEIKVHCTRAARESFPEWFGERWEDAYGFYYNGLDEIRKVRQISALNGAEDLLVWLKQHKIPAFVVSNKRGDYLRLESAKLGWDDHFVAIIGAQDSPRDKPAREHVDFALNYGDLEANSSVWFVGDSEIDMLAARNSGCTPVFIGAEAAGIKLGIQLTFPDCGALHAELLRSKG